MKLNIATHFAHGGAYSAKKADRLIDLVRDAGADGIRDGLAWSRVESSPGVYAFDDWKTSYLDRMLAEGIEPTLTLLARNPLYDGGDTAHRADAIAAFADYVAAVLDRFPGLTEIAIGNEFNGLNETFVDGPAAGGDLAARAAHYTRIIEAVSTRISEDHPEVKLIGGAMHSVPTGYVEHLIDAGATDYMDAIDVHPYGSDPEAAAAAFARLSEVLSVLPEEMRPEIVVTEFGRSADDDPLSNPSYLLKMAAIMSAAGVTEASWYALLDEDASGTPDMGLFDTPDRANALLPGFQLTADLLDGGPAEALDLGPGISAYRFADGQVVAWGSAQAVRFGGEGLSFRTADGSAVDRPAMLSDVPVLVTGRGISIEAGGPGTVLADSFHDFTLGGDGPWEYFAEKTRGDRTSLVELEVMDGQTRMDEAWNPYLGGAYFRPFMVTAESVRPVDFGTAKANERAVLERFVADAAGPVDLVGSWSVGAGSTDGVVVEIRLNDMTLHSERITGDEVLALRDIAMDAGDRLDVLVHDGGSDAGDLVDRHVRILTADAALSTEALLATHSRHDHIEGNEIADAPPSEARAQAAGAWPEAVFGGAGEDRMIGDDGRDWFVAGAGDDLLRGRDGDDILEAGAGKDRLNGDAGDDLLIGGAGRSILRGGDGDDTLKAGTGDQTLVGGNGADHFVFEHVPVRATLHDFDPNAGDVLDLSGLGLAGADALRVREKGDHAHLEIARDDAWDLLARVRKSEWLDGDGQLATAVESGTIVI